MLIKASSNEEAARFSNAIVSSKLILNDNIYIEAKNSTRSNPLHNSSVSEHYRMANQIKDTTFVGCHVNDSAGALAQRLNATQSTCWSHVRKDRAKCVNCQRATSAAATSTTMATMATMTTMTTRVAAGSNESAIESDIEDDDCSDSNCDSDSAEIDNVTVNKGDARSCIDSKTVTENVFLDNEVTTVLNGAKFSKIMNMLQININNSAGDSNKCKEEFANTYVNEKYGKTVYNNDKRNSNSNNIVFSERSPKLATINLSQNSSSSNLIECSEEKKANSTLTDEAIAKLLTLWLALVAFCDAVTIKHDDPRLKYARKRQEQDKSRQEQQRKSTESQSLHGNEEDISKTKPSRHLKLLTNRKLIFLFIVCAFFSCLNRIEGRPNSLTQQNLITDAFPVTLPTASSVVAATTSKAAGQDESGATTARLSVSDHFSRSQLLVLYRYLIYAYPCFERLRFD